MEHHPRVLGHVYRPAWPELSHNVWNWHTRDLDSAYDRRHFRGWTSHHFVFAHERILHPVLSFFTTQFQEMLSLREPSAITCDLTLPLERLPWRSMSTMVRVVASVFFSRLDFDNNSDVFILAPVAMQSDRQGEGIGRTLIAYGLNDLTDRGVQAVLPYGDPAFYQESGFRQISPTMTKAPFELSQPEGWLGRTLTDSSIESFSGGCACVNALNDEVCRHE